MHGDYINESYKNIKIVLDSKKRTDFHVYLSLDTKYRTFEMIEIIIDYLYTQKVYHCKYFLDDKYHLKYKDLSVLLTSNNSDIKNFLIDEIELISNWNYKDIFLENNDDLIDYLINDDDNRLLFDLPCNDIFLMVDEIKIFNKVKCNKNEHMESLIKYLTTNVSFALLMCIKNDQIFNICVNSMITKNDFINNEDRKIHVTLNKMRTIIRKEIIMISKGITNVFDLNKYKTIHGYYDDNIDKLSDKLKNNILLNNIQYDIIKKENDNLIRLLPNRIEKMFFRALDKFVLYNINNILVIKKIDNDHKFIFISVNDITIIFLIITKKMMIETSVHKRTLTIKVNKKSYNFKYLDTIEYMSNIGEYVIQSSNDMMNKLEKEYIKFNINHVSYSNTTDNNKYIFIKKILNMILLKYPLLETSIIDNFKQQFMEIRNHFTNFENDIIICFDYSLIKLLK